MFIWKVGHCEWLGESGLVTLCSINIDIMLMMFPYTSSLGDFFHNIFSKCNSYVLLGGLSVISTCAFSSFSLYLDIECPLPFMIRNEGRGCRRGSYPRTSRRALDTITVHTEEYQSAHTDGAPGAASFKTVQRGGSWSTLFHLTAHSRDLCLLFIWALSTSAAVISSVYAGFLHCIYNIGMPQPCLVTKPTAIALLPHVVPSVWCINMHVCMSRVVSIIQVSFFILYTSSEAFTLPGKNTSLN